MQAVRQIPVPVLYGVFLYMGIASLSGNQFFERILLLGMQPSLYPAQPHTNRETVSRRKLHAYTVLQLALFLLLYVVKSNKAIAIAFPLVIAACIPIRLFVLPRLFTEAELKALDGEDAHADEPAAVAPAEVEVEIAGRAAEGFSAGRNPPVEPADNNKRAIEASRLPVSPSAQNLLTAEGDGAVGESPACARSGAVTHEPMFGDIGDPAPN